MKHKGYKIETTDKQSAVASEIFALLKSSGDLTMLDVLGILTEVLTSTLYDDDQGNVRNMMSVIHESVIENCKSYKASKMHEN